MALTFDGSGGVFTVLGKLFHAVATKLTAQGTTVPTEINDFLTAYEALPDNADYQGAIAQVPSAIDAERNNQALANSLATTARAALLVIVKDDTALPANTTAAAVLELIAQMEAGSETVDASAPSVSVTAGGSNEGDCVLIASVKSGDGRAVEHAFAETLDVTVQGTSLRIAGEAQKALLAHDWPGGSGASVGISPIRPGAGILGAVGTFDSDDDRTNAPDDWIVSVGTIGTTIKLTAVEVQTVVISGDPTSGDFTLIYTDAEGDVQTTAPIGFDATASEVQSALRALTGLSQVEVVRSGTAPNFTHTITFTGVAGNVAILASVESFDTGSIAHNQTTAGSAHAYTGRALEFDSDGSQLTELRYRLTSLQPNAVYGLCCRMKVDAFPAAGALRIDLADGSGAVITDDLSVANSISVDPRSGGDLSTSEFTPITGFFRTPEVLPSVIYLRLRISTAISNTASVFFDDLAIVQATQLYTGGPFVAAFGTPKAADTWTIAVTNAREGGFQDWFWRAGLTRQGQLLPSDSGGSETIADSLIG